MGGLPRRTSCLVADSPGFTGLGAPSLLGFPFSPLPGQCISSQPLLRALTHCVAPLMRGFPGAPALAGPCYWLVASGTTFGWRGGCLALASAVPWRCVRDARGRFGGLGPVPGVVSPLFPPFSPRVSRAVCAGPSRPGVAYPRSVVRHSTRSVRSASSVPLPLRYSPRVLCVCVRSRSCGVHSPPPCPPVGVARAPRAGLALGAGRPVPRGPCPSACPAPVSCSVWRAWGGATRSRFPPTQLWVVRSLWGGSALPGRSRAGWGWGWGRPVRRAPRFCDSGGQWGGGPLCFVLSLCLPWAGNKAGVTCVARVMEGVAPIPLRFVLACRLWARSVWRLGALARVRLFSTVPVGAGGWGVGRALLSPSSRAQQSCRGEGGPSPLPSGRRGRRPRRLWAGVWGWGGEGRAAASLLSLWGAACGSLPCPPLVAGAFPPWRALSVGVAGPPRAPGAACLAGGRGGGAAREPPPRGLRQTQPVPLPSPSGQHCGCHWRCSGHGGRDPHTFPVCGRVPPPAVVCAREQAVGGAEARDVRVELRPSPGVAVPSGGGRTSPRLRRAEGRRSRGSQAGGGSRGGQRGGYSAAPRPPAPLGGPWPPPLSSFVSGAPPWGILLQSGSLGGRGCRSRPGRPP